MAKKHSSARDWTTKQTIGYKSLVTEEQKYVFKSISNYIRDVLCTCAFLTLTSKNLTSIHIHVAIFCQLEEPVIPLPTSSPSLYYV